jgi:hypothetical protein
MDLRRTDAATRLRRPAAPRQAALGDVNVSSVMPGSSYSVSYTQTAASAMPFPGTASNTILPYRRLRPAPDPAAARPTPPVPMPRPHADWVTALQTYGPAVGVFVVATGLGAWAFGGQAALVVAVFSGSLVFELPFRIAGGLGLAALTLTPALLRIGQESLAERSGILGFYWWAVALLLFGLKLFRHRSDPR